MKYAFNENLVSQSGTPGQVKTFNIAGYSVRATVGANGYATVNASPYYQALFAVEDKNGNTTWQTKKTSGGEEIKYGYLDIDEATERFSTQRAKYGANSGRKTCQTKMRWLDHYGNWCYWVFENGTRGVSDSNGGETLTNVVDWRSVSRPQQKSSSETIVLCAPNVDEETWEFLTDIRRSVHVCIDGKNEWIPVRVQPGSSNWVRDQKKMTKQDFEVTVVFNDNTLSL